jgi:hypothetical protein
LAYIDKNLYYWGGSFIAMLSHGLGVFFKGRLWFSIFALFLFSLVCMVLFVQAKRDNLIVLPLAMIIAAFFVGMFGFSSFSSGIPAFVIYSFLSIYKRNFVVFGQVIK